MQMLKSLFINVLVFPPVTDSESHSEKKCAIPAMTCRQELPRCVQYTLNTKGTQRGKQTVLCGTHYFPWGEINHYVNYEEGE